MKWMNSLTVEDSGKVYYKGIEVELTCANLINLFGQGTIEDTLEQEVVEFIRDIKIDMLLKGRQF